MREILFKAKRLDNGECVDGFYLTHMKKELLWWSTIHLKPGSPWKAMMDGM